MNFQIRVSKTTLLFLLISVTVRADLVGTTGNNTIPGTYSTPINPGPITIDPTIGNVVLNGTTSKNSWVGFMSSAQGSCTATVLCSVPGKGSVIISAKHCTQAAGTITFDNPVKASGNTNYNIVSTDSFEASEATGVLTPGNPPMTDGILLGKLNEAWDINGGSDATKPFRYMIPVLPLAPDSMATLTGYGPTGPKDPMDQNANNWGFDKNRNVTSVQIFTYSPLKQQILYSSLSCAGDSGGPIFGGSTLFGIHYAGYNPNCTNPPPVGPAYGINVAQFSTDIISKANAMVDGCMSAPPAPGTTTTTQCTSDAPNRCDNGTCIAKCPNGAPFYPNTCSCVFTIEEQCPTTLPNYCPTQQKCTRSCPPGTVFNPIVCGCFSSCSDPKKPNVCSYGIPGGVGASSCHEACPEGRTWNRNTCTCEYWEPESCPAGYDWCSLNNWCKAPCTKGTTFDPVTCACTDTGGNPICPEGKNWCAGEHWCKKACPAGTTFNPTTCLCLTPDETNTGDGMCNAGQIYCAGSQICNWACTAPLVYKPSACACACPDGTFSTYVAGIRTCVPTTTTCKPGEVACGRICLPPQNGKVACCTSLAQDYYCDSPDTTCRSRDSSQATCIDVAPPPSKPYVYPEKL